MTTFRLLKPSLDLLSAYREALQAGWSPNTVSPEETRQKELHQIAGDAVAFVAGLDDPQAKGPALMLPDGTVVPRLPSIRRWIHDGEFCGSISFRWQPGTATLPPYVLGHIGYIVVPWKRGRGYAQRALALLLPEAKALGMPYVELTCNPDNIASRKTITGCGGRFVEQFARSAAYGAGGELLRYRIYLN